MTNDIDLSGVPEGSILCIYDLTEAFAQRIRRAMHGRPDLSILYLRPSRTSAYETKGFVVMSFKEAQERYMRSLEGKIFRELKRCNEEAMLPAVRSRGSSIQLTTPSSMVTRLAAKSMT